VSTVNRGAVARAKAELGVAWEKYATHGVGSLVLGHCRSAGEIAATAGHPLQWWSDQKIPAWGDSELWGAFARGFRS
jgi:hypothetical protein